MLNILLSVVIDLCSPDSSRKTIGGMPSMSLRIGPTMPPPFIAVMNALGDPKSGAPEVKLRTMLTPIRNFIATSGSAHSGCGGFGCAKPHTTDSSVCALAVFTFTAPCPQTVIGRFFGLVGSGSTKVVQKSSLTPRTRCTSSRLSKAAFLRL